MRTFTHPRVLAATGALALTFALAACGDDDTGPGAMMGGVTTSSGAASAPSSTSDHDRADVMFSMMMVPHHEQALEMAALVPERSQDPALRALAARITAEQQPEIDRMSGWLRGWGVAVPTARTGGTGMSGGMAGMMSSTDMSALEGLTGTAFDRRWLELMVAHHQGAITMAESVLRTGRDAATKELALSVVETQQREIDEMRAMLAG